MLVLRTSNANLKSCNDFQWPELGYVEAPDWNNKPECGGGLHGLPWGEGDGLYLNWEYDAKWQVIEVNDSDVICFNGKCKFSKGNVVHTGDQLSATNYILNNGGGGRCVVGATVSADHYGTATAGDYGKAIAGYRGTATAGYRGTATVGDYGKATAGHGGTAIAGHYGTAIVGICGTATAGYRGTATAGDYGKAIAGYCGTATAGYRGTATAGYGGTATAGDYGRIEITWHNGNKYRKSIAYVGENGILANTPYKLDKFGKFIQANGE